MYLFAIACGGQGTDLKDTVNPSADGGVTQGNAPGTPYTDPFAGAPAYVKPKGGGNSHNAGQACGNKGCHGGGEGPPFLIGGTIYSDYAGMTPAVGIEIRVADMNGHAMSTYSDSGGNFYIKSSGASVVFPAVVGARDGNLSRPMITQLTGTMGSCAQTSCHEHPANPNAQDPVHFP
jgi:hypothetical protein